MHIDADLCGGCIEVVGGPRDGYVELALRGDSASTIKQWFHFGVSGARGRDLLLVFPSANEASFMNSFSDYRALGSYDLENWFRVDTGFDGRRLLLRHKPERDIVVYSYWAAYTLDRTAALLSRAVESRRARVLSIGQSVEGRSIDLVIVGEDGPGKKRIWISTRQHPGETQGSYFVEGALTRLLDEGNGFSEAFLREAVVFFAPNMNPDGATRGNFRTNAAGRDLNREWATPSAKGSPEVMALRAVMEEAGVDLFLDLHGDEASTCSFACGCDGNPGYSRRLHRLERAFAEGVARRDPHFSPDYDYGPDDPGKGDLRIANNWVGERFDCLSMTIEMPFKDVERASGFSPEKARAFGRHSLEIGRASCRERVSTLV